MLTDPDAHDTLDDEPAVAGEDIATYLAHYNARLIHAHGSVAIEVAGELPASETGLPSPVAFRLIPERCVLARILKWRKLDPPRQMALVAERLNADSLAEFREDLRRFIAQAAQRASQAGLQLERFLGALQSGRELASRRFQVVEDRLEEAIFEKQQTDHAEAALRTVRLARYPESFAVAAGMRRRFVAILGPTNSGKTHRAMEALAAAATGVYLAPLRLLALENYERLAERGVAVSLITGEERRIDPDATHVASTIEMLDASRRVDVAVIDEIQMLEDLERGSAWTAAVCGAPAPVVYLLGSLTARRAVQALAERLECPLELITLQRMSPLEMEDEPVRSVGQLRRGDAVIAFSRRDVLAWASSIAQSGLKVATIYGNLSPEVRRAQAQRFREGEADVVVATDAIGMGLNMPIRRVVFTTAKKFDGISEDLLAPWLAQQIAGRAGRFGIHEAGHIAGFDDSTHRLIGRLMKSAPDPLATRGFFVTPTLDQLESIAQVTGEPALARLLELFSRNIDLTDDFFLPGDLSEQIERAQWLDTLPLSLAQRFTFSLVPLSTRVESLNQAWQGWARTVAAGRTCPLRVESLAGARYPLQAAEDACRKYSAYAWLGYRMPAQFPDAEAAVEVARETSQRVDAILAMQNESAPRERRGGHLRTRSGRARRRP